MKRSLIIATCCFLLLIHVQAQKIKTAAVPTAVAAAFGKLYPGVPATWEKEHGNYEATFKQSGTDWSALFSASGQLVETESNIAVATLPQVALSYVRAHFKGKKIKEAAKIVKANGVVSYEADVEGHDVLFDEQGRFLRTTKE